MKKKALSALNHTTGGALVPAPQQGLRKRKYKFARTNLASSKAFYGERPVRMGGHNQSSSGPRYLDNRSEVEAAEELYGPETENEMMHPNRGINRYIESGQPQTNVEALSAKRDQQAAAKPRTQKPIQHIASSDAAGHEDYKPDDVGESGAKDCGSPLERSNYFKIPPIQGRFRRRAKGLLRIPVLQKTLLASNKSGYPLRMQYFGTNQAPGREGRPMTNEDVVNQDIDSMDRDEVRQYGEDERRRVAIDNQSRYRNAAENAQPRVEQLTQQRDQQVQAHPERRQREEQQRQRIQQRQQG